MFRGKVPGIIALILLWGLAGGCRSGAGSGDASEEAAAVTAQCESLCELLPQCVLDSQVPEDCVSSCAAVSAVSLEAETQCARDHLDCRCVRSVEDLAAFTAERCAGGEFDNGLSGNLLPIRVMTYNIGNPDQSEPHYPLRLSYQDYEDFIGARIREVAPDVVVLQEVLSNDHICGDFQESDPERTCFDFMNRTDPVRRILGGDYTIVCDQNLQTECIGVRTGFGGIEGVAITPSLPLPSCNWAAGECDPGECDRESTVSAVVVTTSQGNFRLVHLHPHAGNFESLFDFDTGEDCRALQFRQAFEGYGGEGPLVGTGTTLVLGDWNIDEFFLGNDEEAVLARNVGCDQRFRLLNPVERDGFLTATNREADFSLDRVALDRGAGECMIYGPAADGSFLQDPLDAAFDFSLLPGGEGSDDRIDHFAVVCDVTLSF